MNNLLQINIPFIRVSEALPEFDEWSTSYVPQRTDDVVNVYWYSQKLALLRKDGFIGFGQLKAFGRKGVKPELKEPADLALWKWVWPGELMGNTDSVAQNCVVAWAYRKDITSLMESFVIEKPDFFKLSRELINTRVRT